MENTISVNLKIWRQRGPKEKGQFVNYHLDNVSTGSSFLEMLDMLNQQLVEKGEEPVVFDNDCREGICGMCSLYINGHPAGRRHVSFNCGGAQDANSLPISKEVADVAMDSATCIGCGACVAACKNGSAMLFVSAKVSQFALLPQGQVERKRRARAMVRKMDELGFGNCTNTGACAAECPKNIPLSNIARLNREYIAAKCSE